MDENVLALFQSIQSRTQYFYLLFQLCPVEGCPAAAPFAHVHRLPGGGGRLAQRQAEVHAEEGRQGGIPH